jgi:hypothetical protein
MCIPDRRRCRNCKRFGVPSRSAFGGRKAAKRWSATRQGCSPSCPPRMAIPSPRRCRQWGSPPLPAGLGGAGRTVCGRSTHRLPGACGAGTVGIALLPPVAGKPNSSTTPRSGSILSMDMCTSRGLQGAVTGMPTCWHTTSSRCISSRVEKPALPAQATPILDTARRRALIASIDQKLGGSRDLAPWVEGSPLIAVGFLVG